MLIVAKICSRVLKTESSNTQTEFHTVTNCDLSQEDRVGSKYEKSKQ